MITPQPENVTPTKAKQWLNANNNNRALREGVVEKYAADMKAGKWTQCAAPIWFYENGDIADGQHRLYAIIEADRAQTFLVGRGLKQEDGLNIDTGVPRNLVDNARISGSDPGLNLTLISTCRGIDEGDRSTKYTSNAMKLEQVARHREAALFAMNHGAHGTRLRNSMINAAIGRAWYYEGDKERLAHFGKVLSSGFAEGTKDAAAIALRNYMLAGKVAPGADQNQWRDTFLKAQNAIHYFMRGRSLTVIKGVQDEAYPLKKGRGR